MYQVGVGSFTSNDKQQKMIADILESGRISYGPYCKDFEKSFASLHDRKFGILSNSGTSSLHVALQTLKELHGWEDGDEVIVPAATFVATINIVYHNRMTPVLADIEPGTWAIDPNRIRDAITPRTRCIIPVHPFGQPANMRVIQFLAWRHGLKIIEDSCECVGAMHEGYSVGSWSDISCFSFYVAHIITTGVGGMSCTNNPDYASHMRSLVNHGRDNVYISMDDSDPDRLKEVIGKRFSFPRIGHSFRITELEAALGLEQLARIASILDRRELLANFLKDKLYGYIDTLATRPATTNSWMMFPIIAQGNKKELCEYLEKNGIETRDCLPLTNQPAYDFNEDAYPFAKLLNENGFYVGCHQDLSFDDMRYIAAIIKEF